MPMENKNCFNVTGCHHKDFPLNMCVVLSNLSHYTKFIFEIIWYIIDCKLDCSPHFEFTFSASLCNKSCSFPAQTAFAPQDFTNTDYRNEHNNLWNLQNNFYLLTLLITDAHISYQNKDRVTTYSISLLRVFFVSSSKSDLPTVYIVNTISGNFHGCIYFIQKQRKRGCFSCYWLV